MSPAPSSSSIPRPATQQRQKHVIPRRDWNFRSWLWTATAHFCLCMCAFRCLFVWRVCLSPCSRSESQYSCFKWKAGLLPLFQLKFTPTDFMKGVQFLWLEAWTHWQKTEEWERETEFVKGLYFVRRDAWSGELVKRTTAAGRGQRLISA